MGKLLAGIIAEDTSDVNSVKVLIKAITNKNIGSKQFVGKGSGKILRKCKAWSEQLALKGCSVLILIQDSDTSNTKKIEDLHDTLKNALATCSIKKHIISIPVQELEAWLLSDPSAIAKTFNLKKTPKVLGKIENINSPKEHLGKIVAKEGKTFIHTIHNEKIASNLNLKTVLEKSASFEPFYNFIRDNI